MLSCSIGVGNCIGGAPEPKICHFVCSVAVACPRACSCLLAYGCWQRPALSLDPQPGSSAWIIPMSHASTVEVEGQQCLRPSYLIVFANKAVVGERPHFPSVWHSSSSVLSSATSHNQDSAAVGCFSEEATSNHVIWSSDGKLRDFNTLERCGVGLGGQRDTLTFPLRLLRRTGRAHLQLNVCGQLQCEHQTPLPGGRCCSAPRTCYCVKFAACSGREYFCCFKWISC